MDNREKLVKRFDELCDVIGCGNVEQSNNHYKDSVFNELKIIEKALEIESKMKPITKIQSLKLKDTTISQIQEWKEASWAREEELENEYDDYEGNPLNVFYRIDGKLLERLEDLENKINAKSIE